ncbi:MAG: glucans biosynthesis glucosyltransferase MdoH [Pseudomonadota bacterium]|nr:glucans biosynthesis glucosyltransferase MdoH [Pseudomonadota bacterium]
MNPLLALPPEARLAMPRQEVDGPRLPNREGWRNRGTAILARVLLAVGTLALTAYGVREMYMVMAAGGITNVQWLFFALFAINFAWVGFAACQAALGFIFLLGPAPRHLRRKRRMPAEPMRTAVLFPVYCENPERIGRAVRDLAAGLAAEAPGQFAVFILSDTNRAPAWIEEEASLHRLIAESDPRCPVYYRHRRRNTERKAGNIGDWVTRWGADWEAMVILDADSVMQPATLIEMARRMAVEPGLGLLQTAPIVWRAESLFGRMQQFANRCYGPVVARGLSAWHGRDGNFWGHNAIIRTAAFASAAGLPTLPGRPPFGGHVLSHDFVEAALLRRAGWGVRLDSDLGGSAEEAPPALRDVIIRDRRWCQGNLQHARFVVGRGFSLPSRLHMASGIMAYLSSPLWLALVVVGLVLAWQASTQLPGYFSARALFPTWPVFDSERAVQLFLFSMAIVLAPKIMAVVATIVRPSVCRGFGGPFRLLASVVLETILSALYAPVMMIAHSRLVMEVLRGKDSGWNPQRRGDGQVPLGVATRAHTWQIVSGLAFAFVAFQLNPDLFYWLLPVSTGLVLAGVLEWASGSVRFGTGLRRLGLLVTPEERMPAPAIEEAADIPEPAARGPMERVAADPDLRAWHVAQLQGAPVDQLFDADLILARAKAARLDDPVALGAWLTPAETMALLHDPDEVARLSKTLD